MKNKKWLFFCIIAVIVLLVAGIVYQFIVIKNLEHKINSSGYITSSIIREIYIIE